MKRTIFSAMALLLASVAGCGTTTPATPAVCATVTCPMNQFCDGVSGACKMTSVCAGVTCGAGTVCDGTTGSATAGTCVTETCGATQCTNGQVCNQSTLACVNPGIPSLAGLGQIDRMGRPAVNTALTNAFDVYPGNVASPYYNGLQAESSDATKQRYNSDANPAMWAANWTPAFKQALSVIDSFDGSCTNTFGYVATAPYDALAAALVADALQVDTSKTTCSIYLALEGGVTTDCGGRMLNGAPVAGTHSGYDVIDATYSLIATGKLTNVTDGILQPTLNAPTTTFPFFAPPI